MEALLHDSALALVKINTYDSIFVSELFGFNVDGAPGEVCYCGICQGGMKLFTGNGTSVIYCKRCGLRVNLPSDVMSLDDLIEYLSFENLEEDIVRRGICPRCFGTKKIQVIGESHGLKIPEIFNCSKCQE